ncbi:type II toxin-antitoxin system RelE/ParE family toxin [Segatella copri]|uniref:type II toxin-antitoxin system RelE/ParE family toxin n=1 Tax=Segatella copri TaxID=165179 RepID=UPI0039824FE5
MAKVTLRNSFLQIYEETTDYSYQNFGRLCVQRFDESLQAIINRLSKHPLSSPREPLLKRFHRPYHSAIIKENWKIIYRYDEANDLVIFVDLWDMRRSPRFLIRQFKRKL